MDVDQLTLLRHTDAFARLGDEQLRKLARTMKERKLARNQVLFRQGDVADSLYIIASGRIRVSAIDRTGRERVLAFLGTGELVGEMGVLSGQPRSATITATTDAHLLQLRKPDFDSLAANNVDLMRDLAVAVAQRSMATQQRAAEQVTTGGYRQGLITAVYSPRGGSGTTTIATNLAVALAQGAPERVALLDLHSLFCHTPVLLNVNPRRSLAAISPVSLRQMDRENLEFYLTTHAESSLKLLTGVLRPEEGELLTADHVKSAVELLRSQFVHVIIDLPRGFGDTTLVAIERCHNLLVVCTPDKHAVRGVRECQRIFRQLLQLPGEPMQLLINYPTPYAAFTAQALEAMLEQRAIDVIPYGGDQPARAALEGQPLVTRWPNSPTTKVILGLGERLDQQLAEARAISSASFLTVP